MKAMGQRKSAINVLVYDYASKPIKNAKLTLRPKGVKSRAIVNLAFSKKLQAYRTVVKPGTYILTVSANGLQPDEREVRVGWAELKELFVLGKKGMPSLQRGKVKVPFKSHSNLLGIAFKPGITERDEKNFNAFMKEMNLSEEEVGPMIRKGNLRVFRFPAAMRKSTRMNIQAQISEHDLVQYAGQVVGIDEDSVSFLSSDVIIKFKSSIAKEEVYEFAKRFHVTVIRHIPYAGNTFQVRFSGPAVYHILDVCNEMMTTDVVEYAEPDLYSTPVYDQTHPTDYLYPEQWHHALIDTPGAWQILSNINPNFTFGRPDIIVAVFDSGVDTNHSDLNGHVSSGAPKIHKLFDFTNMVANNDTLDSDNPTHGTGCAGAAVGMANNPAAVSGLNEGMAGVAGNCRLMGIRIPGFYPVPESRYSDAYIWMAGFDPDPNNTIADFPDPISPGADIISNSFKYTCGCAVPVISGLMSDTFDFLTTYGRNGKGVLLFFSVGNSSGPTLIDYTLKAPWAAYEKTFAIAASTLKWGNERRAAYSNVGASSIIDLCAPSHDAYVAPGLGPLHNPSDDKWGAFTCDLVGNGNLPGHPVTQTTLQSAVNKAPLTGLISTEFWAADIGDTTIDVPPTGFAPGQWIRIGQHGNTNAEWVQITGVGVPWPGPGPGTRFPVSTLTRKHKRWSPVFGTTKITVESTAGFVDNSWLLLGEPGQPNTEACLIMKIVDSQQLIIAGPLQDHAAGTPVITGPNDYRNSFGGTSFSTPVCAGVAALVLSANPELNWVRVRQILRTTATKISPNETDSIGSWKDLDGDGVAEYSGFYGYGRVNAQAAVQEALNLVGVGALADIDTWIKQNTADIGDVPSAMMPYDSPDVWVRNLDPMTDQATGGQRDQHQSPIRNKDNWVYVNVWNRGSVDSQDVYVRIFITPWPSGWYVYPDDFIPTNPPGTNPVQPFATPGTYLIDELHIDTIPAGGVVTVHTLWPSALVPPAAVNINGVYYSAAGCLLVDVSPHDGPTPTGNHTWDNNNLCQRDVFPVDSGDSDILSIVFGVGHLRNLADLLPLRIVRRRLPVGVQLYFDYIDMEMAKNVNYLLNQERAYENVPHLEAEKALPITLASITRPTLPDGFAEAALTRYQLFRAPEERATVFALPAANTAYVPIPREKGRYHVVALMMKGLKRLKKGQYQIDIYQENLQGRIEGGINFIINKKK